MAPTCTIPKTYADGDYLYESDIDGIRNALLTFLNTTKLDSDNLQASITQALVPAGVIHPYVSDTAPTGYLLCDGSSLLKASYPTLYAVIGDKYGTADSTHFNVPDFRGMFLRGYDSTAGRDPDSAGRTAMATGGATGNNIGSVQADATAKNGLTATTSTTSSTSSDGVHSHSTSTGNPHILTRYAGATTISVAGGGADNYVTTDTLANSGSHSHTVTSTSTTTVGAGDNETRPLNAYVNYIIKY